MLTLKTIDLESLADALEDNGWEQRWFFDARSGETVIYFEGGDNEWLEDEEEDLDAEHFIEVEPVGSRESYRDMEEFIDGVDNEQAKELLLRAIDGKGAFRRFRATVSEFPEIDTAWHTFHRRIGRGRAITWLMEKGLVDEPEAQKALDAL